MNYLITYHPVHVQLDNVHIGKIGCKFQLCQTDRLSIEVHLHGAYVSGERAGSRSPGGAEELTLCADPPRLKMADDFMHLKLRL